MNITGIDVNLFVVLHAVLEERSATRAARRLHVTQSAVSNALARLREVMGDPLVVRSGRGLTPTPRALEIAPRVALAVRELSHVLEQERGFVPTRSTREFVLACTDSQQPVDLPRIARLFEQRLPRATLRIVTIEQLIASNGLVSGSVDAALGPPSVMAPGHHHAPLYEEEGAMVVRRDHPLVRERVSREQFETLPHVEVRVAGVQGEGHRRAREAMAAVGMKRHVGMVVPSFMAGALVVSQTDYLGSLSRRFVESVSHFLPIRLVEAPFGPPVRLPISLLWHERTHEDPGARFFRELVIEALRTPPAPTRKPRRKR